MLICMAAVWETELEELLPLRAAMSTHTLTDDPAAAEMILLIGSFGLNPERLLEHPLYKSWPEKCAVYTEDDNYLPLAPGVYCSAKMDEHSACGRVSSYAYVSADGRYSNPYVAKMTAPKKKQYLFTFLGGSTSLLRKRLYAINFAREDVLVEDTSAYWHWDDSQDDRRRRQERYAELMVSGEFALCPRGAGNGSIRFFEAMMSDVAPVLVADEYALPPGVEWERFMVRVAEKDLVRLPSILEPLVGETAERGRLAREAWEQRFAPERQFDAIVEQAWAALHHGGPSEADFVRQQRTMIARAERKRKLRGFARTAVLKTLKVLRVKNPYRMNRDD